jgi:hypothetical protein
MKSLSMKSTARRLAPLRLLAGACLPAGAASAQTVFPIDQRYGSIEFSVDHLCWSARGGRGRSPACP